MAEFKNLANTREFYRVVRPLFCPEVEALGLFPSSGLGDFFPDRLPEIIDFCEKNPQYHIISIYRGLMYFNRIFFWADAYKLARGSIDKSISSYPKKTFEKYQERLITKLHRNEEFAESGELEAIKKLIFDF